MRTLLAAFTLGAALVANAQAFELSSPELKPNQKMPKAQEFNGFGCTGDNLSPALAWKNPPKGTKSFALTVYDPDAPTGSGWWHWVVYNIPADATSLPAGAGVKTPLANGILQGRNDYGAQAFGGACPPQGDKPHHYIFTVYALKVDKLDVPADASPALIGFTLHGATITKAKFTALYSR